MPIYLIQTEINLANYNGLSRFLLSFFVFDSVLPLLVSKKIQELVR